jgi:hypothetical protein
MISLTGTTFVMTVLAGIVQTVGMFARCGGWQGRQFAHPGSTAALLCHSPSAHWHVVRMLMIWVPWGGVGLMMFGGMWAAVRGNPSLYHRLVATCLLAIVGTAVIWFKIPSV